jgi:S1-C subfamily serine protease
MAMFDLLDGILLVAVVAFGVSGYRQGFIVGAFSFIGFLGGAVLGAKLAPSISDWIGNGHRSPLTGIIVVFAGAILGQLVASAVAAAVRTRIQWRPAQAVDSVGGAIISGISVLLVAWLMATAVNRSPYESLRRQIHGSGVIQAVDALVPDSARQLFANFLRLVEQQGFPQVFAGLGGDTIIPTSPPDPALAGSAIVTRVKPSILKVTGDAPSCSKSIEGSSFVYSPEHVMTNAHVVAGVPHPSVEVDGQRIAATTVLFDPKRDVAVLYVPGLRATPLAFAPQSAASGDSAIVIGYPENGPFTPVAARVRDRINARGVDIYSQSTVTREIYGLRAQVLPGNSGGPLISTTGQVYGVVFAAATDDSDTGYALTANEVTTDAVAGYGAKTAVSTGGCD